ncbi:MAG: lipopolysaccharide transport system permease protein [Kiritimatiellia bacterium]|jgi:lipopolysaccharide transport system permease protein
MSKNIIIYNASNEDRLSLRAWPMMFRELVESRELINRLVMRDMASQVRQSFLGYLWILLPPVATTVVFSLLRQANIINVPMADGAMPYALFVLVGTTIWGLFTQTTIMATSSIAISGNLVSKIYFPREILIFSATIRSVINTAIRIVAVVAGFIVFLYPVTWQVIFIPVLLVPIVFFAIGLGLLLAPINTMMHDISRMLELLFQFGMFLAPTVYPTPALASADSSWKMLLYLAHNVNPVSHTIHAVQHILEHGTVYLDAGFGVATGISFLVFFMGWRFFHACEPLLAERL